MKRSAKVIPEAAIHASISVRTSQKSTQNATIAGLVIIHYFAASSSMRRERRLERDSSNYQQPQMNIQRAASKLVASMAIRIHHSNEARAQQRKLSDNTPVESTYLFSRDKSANSDCTRGACVYNSGSTVILVERSVVREEA